MKNPTWKTRSMKNAVAAIGVGGQAAFETESHPRVQGTIRELRLDDEVPYLIMSAKPYKQVRVDLRNIKRIL